MTDSCKFGAQCKEKHDQVLKNEFMKTLMDGGCYETMFKKPTL